LLCSSEFEKVTVQAAKQCGISLSRVLVIDAKQPKDWKLVSVADRSNVLDHNGPMLNWKRITDQKELKETTACLLYSSGTTGLPKGVEISHWNLIAVNVCWMPLAQRFIDKRKSENNPFVFSTIAHLPMAHIGGISWVSMHCLNRMFMTFRLTQCQSSLIPFYIGGSAYWVEKYEFKSFIEYHRRSVCLKMHSCTSIYHSHRISDIGSQSSGLCLPYGLQLLGVLKLQTTSTLLKSPAPAQLQ
jgi:acyl-CoA synthetase (AMP-forming)/AMP-acid ligase II